MRMANEGLLNCTENAGPSPVTSGGRVTGVFLEARSAGLSPVTSGRRETGVFLEARSELKEAFEGLGAVGPEAN